MVAFPTKGERGLEDSISYIFGRAEYFTVVDLVDGSIDKVEVVKTPVASCKHGGGPIVVKMFTDMGVKAVAAREIGSRVSKLLEQKNVDKFDVEADVPVKEAVKALLKDLEILTRSFQI